MIKIKNSSGASKGVGATADRGGKITSSSQHSDANKTTGGGASKATPKKATGLTPASGSSSKRKRTSIKKEAASDDDEYSAPHVSSTEARSLGISPPDFQNTSTSTRRDLAPPTRRSSKSAASTTPTPSRTLDNKKTKTHFQAQSDDGVFNIADTLGDTSTLSMDLPDYTGLTDLDGLGHGGFFDDAMLDGSSAGPAPQRTLAPAFEGLSVKRDATKKGECGKGRGGGGAQKGNAVKRQKMAYSADDEDNDDEEDVFESARESERSEYEEGGEDSWA